MSGMFADLMDTEEARIKASVDRDIARSQEQQNAEDNDMYDKWTNGLVSDQEWLKYIKGRVNDTKGDPEEHQQWVKTYREHRFAVQDANMESRYEAGSLSLHKLIAYYDDRMSGLEVHSPEHRELQTRFYGLVDQRDSYYIEDEANRIINRIEHGQAGYGELRDFYNGMLGKVRKSSPLYRQLKNNLQSINEIGGATSSGGGGGSSGGSSGGSGGGDGSKDPYSRASRSVTKLWKSGNVFVPYGPDVVNSVLAEYHMDTRDDTTVWNALGEDSVVIENLIDYAKKHPDDPYLITPWGDRIPNDLEHRQALLNQGLRGYDFRIALGNSQGRSILGVLSARDSFVETGYGAMNDAHADDYWKQVRQNVWERLELAGQNPDPSAALREYEAAGRVLEKAAHNILGEPLVKEGELKGEAKRYAGKALPTGEGDIAPVGQITHSYAKTKLFPEEQVSPEMQEELRYAIDVADFAKSAHTLSPEELQHNASILFDARPESFWLTQTDLEGIFGGDSSATDPTPGAAVGGTPQVGIGLIGKAFAQRGLMANDEINATGQAMGVDPYVFVGLPGQHAPTAVPSESLNQLLGVDDWQDGSTRGGWEKVGNRTSWVVRPLEEVPAPMWWAKGSKWLNTEEYEKLGRDPGALAAAGYEQQAIPEMGGWKKLTDGDGTEWFVDPRDGFLYKDAPPYTGAAGLTGPIFDYSEFIGEDGKVNIEDHRLPASTGRGYVAFVGAGVSMREAQMMTESILDNPLDPRINPGFYHKRDDHNFVQPGGITPEDVIGMYWSESDNAAGDFETDYVKAKGGMLQRGIDYRQNAMRERAESRRKAEVQSWIDLRFQNAKQASIMEKISGTSLEDMATKSIEKAKLAAGINMGNTFRKTKANLMGSQFNAPAAPPSPRPIAPVPMAPKPRRRRHDGGGYTPDFVNSGKVRNLPSGV
jgi:hypothetical protein